MKNLCVTKSNVLIEASYRLSLNELRIILYGISLINPIQKDFPTVFDLNISRFSELFNISKEGLYYDLRNNIIKRFWNREFSYIQNDGERKLSRWLDQIDYCDKKGTIKIYFSERIKPLLYQLKNNFTTYYINQIAGFKKAHSVRIYEICLMYFNKYKGSYINQKRRKIIFKIKLDELKEKLDLSNRYIRFNDFNGRVLEKAKKEINKKSDIRLDYQIEKEGRKAHTIIFSMYKKETVQEKKESLSKKLRDLEYEIQTHASAIGSLIAKECKDYYDQEKELLAKAKKRYARVKKQIDNLKDSP